MLATLACLLGLLFGAVAGGAFGWALAQRKVSLLERQAADAQARSEEKERAIALQRQTAEDLRKELERSFQALAGEALQRNTQQLLTQADLKFQPFDARLKDLKAATEALESKRAQAYGSLEQQLRELKTSAAELKSQSEKLATALRGSSQARGRWGETTLRRLVELAGMQPHCDFDEQTVTEGGQRPDLVVRLPGRGAIPVDAKVPLAAYLDAAEAHDEETRRARLKQHAADMKTHVRALASRDYSKSLGGSVDFTVMFVPGEPFLAAAFAEDTDLFEWGLAQRVLIASPVTLLALLRTVRLNWDHIAVEENAREIQRAAQLLYERFLTFSEHLADTGRHLGSAVKKYNEAIGSYERRILPAGRDLARLRVGDPEKIPDLPAQTDVRQLEGGN